MAPGRRGRGGSGVAAPLRSTGSVGWVRFRSVLTFEVRAQAREPLTTLYALVFFFLALGYAASNAVELVSDRGNVPRTAFEGLAVEGVSRLDQALLAAF